MRLVPISTRWLDPIDHRDLAYEKMINGDRPEAFEWKYRQLRTSLNKGINANNKFGTIAGDNLSCIGRT